MLLEPASLLSVRLPVSDRSVINMTNFSWPHGCPSNTTEAVSNSFNCVCQRQTRSMVSVKHWCIAAQRQCCCGVEMVGHAKRRLIPLVASNKSNCILIGKHCSRAKGCTEYYVMSKPLAYAQSTAFSRAPSPTPEKLIICLPLPISKSDETTNQITTEW